MADEITQHAPATAVTPERGMCEPLQRACQEVRQLLNRNDARDALDRYQIGCIIREVRNAEHTYGLGGVGKIARAVGRDVDTLYEYGDVAETWSQVEITRLLERKTPLGVPLSFTHLVVLSKVRHDRDLLKAMTDRALSGISARHLRALVDEQRRRGGRERGRAAPFGRLAQMVKHCQGVIAASRALDDCLGELRAVESTPRLASLLERALESQRELVELCGENLKRLDAEHARVRADLIATIHDLDDEPAGAARV